MLVYNHQPQEFKLHTRQVLTLDFNEKKQLFASSGFDGLINIWNSSGTIIHSNQQRDIINDLKFTKEGKYLISGGRKVYMQKWNIEMNTVQKTHDSLYIMKLDLSPDEKYILDIGQKRTIRVRNFESMQCLYTLQHLVMAVTFTFWDRRLVSIHKSSKTICLWNIENNRLLRQIQTNDFANDCWAGELLIISGEQSLQIFNKQFKIIKVIKQNTYMAFIKGTLLFSVDTKQAGQGTRIQIRNFTTGALIQTIVQVNSNDLCVTADSLVSTGSGDCMMKFYKQIS